MTLEILRPEVELGIWVSKLLRSIKPGRDEARQPNLDSDRDLDPGKEEARQEKLRKRQATSFMKIGHLIGLRI